jgi:uncharacterized protein
VSPQVAHSAVGPVVSPQVAHSAVGPVVNQASKRILITGASSGIGRALAFEAASQKMDVILSARREPELASLAAELKGKYSVNVHIIPADLSQVASAKALCAAVNAIGPLDALINNAGYGLFGEFKDCALDDTLKMAELNMLSLTVTCRLLLPGLLQTRGKIMNVASTAAFQPGPYMAAYYASKAYVLSFSEALAEELAASSVSVTALCPGPTRSGFQDRAAMHDSALVKDKSLPTSEAVARYGFSAMQKGKRVAVHGIMNWLMAQSIRLTPRVVVTKLVRFLSRPSA